MFVVSLPASWWLAVTACVLTRPASWLSSLRPCKWPLTHLTQQICEAKLDPSGLCQYSISEEQVQESWQRAKGDSFAFMWGLQAVVAHPLLWGRVVTVPQEATLAFNEPILILLPSVCKLFISPHTTYIYIYCKSTHSHALHTGNHRAQAERANFCPSGTGKLIPDKWRASYIPLKTGFQSHLNHMLL